MAWHAYVQNRPQQTFKSAEVACARCRMLSCYAKESQKNYRNVRFCALPAGLIAVRPRVYLTEDAFVQPFHARFVHTDSAGAQKSRSVDAEAGDVVAPDIGVGARRRR